MRPSRQLGALDLLLLVAGYLVLDWASYIHPLHGLNITPWNPAPALGLVFLLRFGWRAVAPLTLAVLAADAWVRDLPASLPISIGLAGLLTLGYWSIAEGLRSRLAGGAVLGDRSGLLSWAVIVAGGSLLVSMAFVFALYLGGLISSDELFQAFVRYWIGEAVGILVSMPVLWMLLDDRGRAQLRAMVVTWESLGYLVATSVALWIAFGIGAKADFKYFYVLFLPIVWAATRQGFAGAVFCAAVVQIGIIGSVQWRGFSTITILEIQVLALALAMVGFFIGIVVDEKQRVSAELSQTLRLAAAGEMAGALAHELNQPLTALSAYATACEHLARTGESSDRLGETLRRMVAESHRAADVLRRLRDFFRTGATRLEWVELRDLFAAVENSFGDKARQHGVLLSIEPAPSGRVLADRLQLDVVLRNLLANAFDAVMERPDGQRRVRLSAQRDGSGRACISVEDSGRGLSDATVARLFEAFQSTKASGMGLGLAISRAIVEAHGGNLWAEVADHGVFKLTLSMEDSDHAN